MSLWRQMKSGDWLTRERLRHYPLIVLALSLIAAVLWIALADGLIDRTGKPIGTDFSNVWVAGKLALSGQPEAPFDPARQQEAVIEAFNGKAVPFFGWHYPPLFLFVASGLALMPYGWALMVWMAFTLSAYLIAMRSILSRSETLLVALAFPAVFVNLGHGQNAFLTAALLAGGLILLDTRPIVSGILIGLLAYKPQFGLLIPTVLLAGARWRVIGAATGAVLGTCAVTLIVFGPETWKAFANSTTFTREVVLEAGSTGWEKIQSIFSAVRIWRGSVEVAYATQGVLALAVAGSLFWLWRSRAAYDLKAAALACGCLLATPYMLDYDLVVLAISMAFFVRYALGRGFLSYEISALAFCWLVPLGARSFYGGSGIPVGLISMIAFYSLILRRAVVDLTADVDAAALKPEATGSAILSQVTPATAQP